MILHTASIPHSGTRLLLDKILKTEWININQKPKENYNYFSHIYTYNAPLHKMRMEQYPSIIVMRHPYLVATSWKKRKMDIGEMCVSWYILVEQLDKYNPYYLPVDHKDRDKYLQRINEGLGLNLGTDWPMTNSKHNTLNPEDLGDDQEQVDRLCENIKPFLSKIYPRKPRRGNKDSNSNKGSPKTRNNPRRRNSGQ